MADPIFFDHHIHSPPSKILVEKFAKETQKFWRTGPIEKMQKQICDCLGGWEKTISIKSSLAEAHQALFFHHYVSFIRETGRTQILTLENEQESIISGIKHLEQFEVRGKYLPVAESGQLCTSVLKESLRARSSLLSFSLAHPLTGVVQPMEEIVRFCRENDLRVHMDISAALGKMELEFIDLDVDFLTFDGGLLGMPFPVGVILSRHSLWESEKTPFALYSNLAEGLSTQCDKVETFAMEVAPLCNHLEKGLKDLGAHIPYCHTERLPNVAVCQFENIHAEQIVHELKKEAIFASSADPFSVSFVLSDRTQEEEVNRLLEVFPSLLEKFRKKGRVFTQEDARAKNMRLCQGVIGEKKEGRHLLLTLLVDEEDGVIADADFEVFGAPALCEAAEVTAAELLRKNYMQARRMTADLIEKKMKLMANMSDFNLLLDAIDLATENCMDIPIEDVYLAPPDMGEGERSVYPGWEELSDKTKKKVIQEVMERDIRPYVELDAGGVDVVKVEDNRVTIAYSGNCTSCFSATGATLDAIGNILRHKIFPDLMVIPDSSFLERS